MQQQLNQLLELQIQRKFFIREINGHTNAAKALMRRILNFKWDDDEKARDAVSARAARIVANVLSGKEPHADDEEIIARLGNRLQAFAKGIEPCVEVRHEVELEMKRIVRKLPVYAWAEPIKGFGEMGLAVIIGEAGNLSNYASVEKLWKRLGLAPFADAKGTVQACGTWRREGGLTADEWVAAKYKPQRRAEIYAVVGEPLFKHQTMRAGPYRAIYDERRARTAITHPDWRPIRSHMDGLRIMTKELISDLWSEWRRADVEVPEMAILGLPAADEHRNAA